MNTHESYVSLETAKMLKQAGFDWECPQAYDIMDGDICNVSPWDVENLGGFVYAPTLEVAQRWLREVKNCDIYVTPTNGLYFVHIRKYLEPVETKCEYSEYPNKFVCHTYEEAQEAGIKKALEIILEKGE